MHYSLQDLEPVSIAIFTGLKNVRTLPEPLLSDLCNSLNTEETESFALQAAKVAALAKTSKTPETVLEIFKQYDILLDFYKGVLSPSDLAQMHFVRGVGEKELAIVEREKFVNLTEVVQSVIAYSASPDAVAKLKPGSDTPKYKL